VNKSGGKGFEKLGSHPSENRHSRIDGGFRLLHPQSDARICCARLFVYDVWVELWGQSFADEQVTIERARTGSLANYDKLWTEALAIPAPERARRFKQFVQEHRK
jgi:hypothetical protein